MVSGEGSSTPKAASSKTSASQAYSPMPPHGFFHSSVASSPQPHPYMWGPQHLMPPYGTPPPPYVMYPHGGMYAHPSMPAGSLPFSPYAMPSPSGPEASVTMTVGAEADGKSSDGKEKSPLKRSKDSLGSLNMITGKNNNEKVKTSGASANGAYSQSAESASGGSSEGSDANSQNDSQPKAHRGKDSLEGESSQNGSSAPGSHNEVSGTPHHPMLNQAMVVMPMPPAGLPGTVAGPTTNLNIGMDYWGTPTPSAVPAVHGKVPPATVPGSVVPNGIAGSREGVQPELWIQDERELKRQRRKQSNRESARRSRLRKQAECEELAQRVEVLKEENSGLKSQVSRIRSEYEQLLSQNSSFKERLGEIPRGSEGDQHMGEKVQQVITKCNNSTTSGREDSDVWNFGWLVGLGSAPGALLGLVVQGDEGGDAVLFSAGIEIFDSNRSLGIKNVIFSGNLSDGNILRSITKLKWLAFCISLMATARSSFVEELSATDVICVTGGSIVSAPFEEYLSAIPYSSDNIFTW
ncbi:hypothetical protein MKW94_018683 [Papaver nudicaule]|uniref:BZIP domain-containing protein n=1 Tax=Papaver nudicaule TaxID=74823 RepID=A0AA41RUL4_PAPNU|nr:hypothetical protein [Papaver nudicaule]